MGSPEEWNRLWFVPISNGPSQNLRGLYLVSSMSSGCSPFLNSFAGSGLWVWSLVSIKSQMSSLSIIKDGGPLRSETEVGVMSNAQCLLPGHEETLPGVIQELQIPPSSQWLCKPSLLSLITVFHQTLDPMFIYYEVAFSGEMGSLKCGTDT